MKKVIAIGIAAILLLLLVPSVSAETVTYYFDARHATIVWTNPDNMVDNNLATYASTVTTGTIQQLITNNCTGTDLGTITKVEVRAYGYGDGDDRIDLRPIFNGNLGTIYQTTPGTGAAWGNYRDITASTNAPSPWTWAAVQNLDINVIYTKSAGANLMYCAIVEIRVTYELYPGAPTNFASPSQTSTTIDLTWTKGANSDKTLIRFKEGEYPTSITDGTQAYFDTGESVTVTGAPASIIQELSDSVAGLRAGSTIRAGERVTNFPVSNINRVSFYLKKLGAPTGTAYIRIRTLDDSILGEVGTLDVSTLTTTLTWYDFDCNIDNPTTQTLRFTVEYDGGDESNYVIIRYQGTDVLPLAVYTSYVTFWSINSAWDVAIKIYYSIPLTPATTYYFRAWGYQSSTGLYSTATADLIQATKSLITDTTFTVTLPVGYTYALFQPPNASAQNWNPDGQNGAQCFYQITNSGNVNLNINITLNSTVSNVILKADTDNNPVGAKQINTTDYVFYSTLTPTNFVNIWIWSDFNLPASQSTNRTLDIHVNQTA